MSDLDASFCKGKPKDDPAWMWFVVFSAAVLILLGLWVCSSYLEARAYNNITGKNVSTWDAMFVELRIQEGAKP